MYTAGANATAAAEVCRLCRISRNTPLQPGGQKLSSPSVRAAGNRAVGLG